MAAAPHRRKRNVEVRQPQVQVGECPQRRPRRRRIKRPGRRRYLQNLQHQLAHVLEIALQLAGAATQGVRDGLRDLAARQARGVVGGRGAGGGGRPEPRGGGRSSAAGHALAGGAAAAAAARKWRPCAPKNVPLTRFAPPADAHGTRGTLGARPKPLRRRHGQRHTPSLICAAARWP